MTPRSDSCIDNTLTLVSPRNVLARNDVRSMKASFIYPTVSNPWKASGSSERMPEGKMSLSIFVRPANAYWSTLWMGL